MSILRMRMAMSLDGYVAGPRQSVEDPLGAGGMRLHEWAFRLAAFRRPHGMEGGEVNESNATIEEWLRDVGASVMGRNMFGGQPGPWRADQPWKGWWGPNPPFHHPVFVLTHHARQPMVMQGGTTFTFVTGGIHDALAQARQAAGAMDVSLPGGAQAAQQYLAAGLVDRMDIDLVPIFLGAGERLFERIGDAIQGLHLSRTIATKGVTHLRFERA